MFRPIGPSPTMTAHWPLRSRGERSPNLRLPGMPALGVGQQREAAVDGDQGAQHAVRDGHRGGARGGRDLDATPAQFAIDRPLGAGRMDLQPFELRRFAHDRVEALQFRRRIAGARLARDFAGHEGDIGIARAVVRQRLFRRQQRQAACRNCGLDACTPRAQGEGGKQEFGGPGRRLTHPRASISASRPFTISSGGGGQPRICRSTGRIPANGPTTAGEPAKTPQFAAQSPRATTHLGEGVAL